MKLPKIQKQRLTEYLKSGKRFDGRGLGEYRDIVIRTGLSNKAEGSASVKFGKTEVYAGVKLDVVTPYPDDPDKGNFVAGLELSPMASPDFEMGPPRIEAIEAGRIIDRGIRESGFINFKKLCIKAGEKVWVVYLDMYAVNDDGNLLDVASLAALAALADARMPKYDEKTEKVDRKSPLTKERLPLSKEDLSFNMTFFKVGNQILLDPSLEEQEAADYRVSFAIASKDGEPRISAMQKGNAEAVSLEEMDKILAMLDEQWQKTFPKVSKDIWEK